MIILGANFGGNQNGLYSERWAIKKKFRHFFTQNVRFGEPILNKCLNTIVLMYLLFLKNI